MKCPICTDVRMREVEKDGVLIDVCPDCKGVWLDRGELDKLLKDVRTLQNEYSRMEQQYYGGQPASNPPAGGLFDQYTKPSAQPPGNPSQPSAWTPQPGGGYSNSNPQSGYGGSSGSYGQPNYGNTPPPPSGGYGSHSAPPPQYGQKPKDGKYYPPQPGQQGYYGGHSSGGYGHGHGGKYPYKKKKNVLDVLGDLFE
ncbi:zf-TFIIB domain-containing protein [Paenibacillus methanolicus]|uniref:TFIIB-like protein n=1 Tax=Paenibacillus methanolicus TaxID=582686 RepID=A0A5S5CK13_9BACL|nr:TFIIB-like protein [Paenibacillus methanolicus]